MKALIQIVFLVLLPIVKAGAQWEVVNEGFKGIMNTMHFVNDGTGWIAGSNGMLMKTTDGGEHWLTIETDESWGFNQIDFLGDSIGWGIGSKLSDASAGVISKSVDGGATWSLEKEFLGMYLRGVQAVDKRTIYALGGSDSGPVLCKSSNGGVTWGEIHPTTAGASLNSMWFTDPDTGILVGSYNGGTRSKGMILKTADGGNSWEARSTDEFDDISGLQFLDATHGYFTAVLDTMFYLCETKNMGKTWEVFFPPEN